MCWNRVRSGPGDALPVPICTSYQPFSFGPTAFSTLSSMQIGEATTLAWIPSWATALAIWMHCGPPVIGISRSDFAAPDAVSGPAASVPVSGRGTRVVLMPALSRTGFSSPVTVALSDGTSRYTIDAVWTPVSVWAAKTPKPGITPNDPLPYQ